MFTEFARVYYGVDPLTVSNFVDIITYKEEFPVFYFDVSKQSERVNQSVVDIKIRMRFAENVGANVVAYALVISDRRLKFQSDKKPELLDHPYGYTFKDIVSHLNAKITHINSKGIRLLNVLRTSNWNLFYSNLSRKRHRSI